MTLEEAKLHLRMDEDNDREDSVIESMILAAENYIRDAVTDYDKKAADAAFLNKSEICQKIILTDLYENRDQLDKETKNFSFLVRSMITQMQYTPVPKPEKTKSIEG